MTILENLEKVRIAIKNDNEKGDPTANPPKPPGALGKELSNAAVAAITNGIKSTEWKNYMSLFADNAKQLERLTVPKDNDPSYLPLMRAYMVSNAVCDVGTNTHTGKNLDVRIDNNPTLPVDSDNSVVRPFKIPGM